MADRGKVIKGLECISNGAKQPCRDCEFSKREEWCIAECAKDALALLKAQQPRVMTLEEVIAHYSLPPVFVDDLGAQEDYYEDIQPLYFEFPNDKDDPWIVHWRGYAQVARYLDDWRPSYNQKWRCWTSRPTDEQRGAVKWDE